MSEVWQYSFADGKAHLLDKAPLDFNEDPALGPFLLSPDGKLWGNQGQAGEVGIMSFEISPETHMRLDYMVDL